MLLTGSRPESPDPPQSDIGRRLPSPPRVSFPQEVEIAPIFVDESGNEISWSPRRRSTSPSFCQRATASYSSAAPSYSTRVAAPPPRRPSYTRGGCAPAPPGQPPVRRCAAASAASAASRIRQAAAPTAPLPPPPPPPPAFVERNLHLTTRHADPAYRMKRQALRRGEFAPNGASHRRV